MFRSLSTCAFGGLENRVVNASLHIPVICLSFLIMEGCKSITNIASKGSSEAGEEPNASSILTQMKSFQWALEGSNNLCNHLVANAFFSESRSRNLQPPFSGVWHILLACERELLFSSISFFFDLYISHILSFLYYLFALSLSLSLSLCLCFHFLSLPLKICCWKSFKIQLNIF